MAITNSYMQRVMEQVKRRNPAKANFCRLWKKCWNPAVGSGKDPRYEQYGVIERLVEPNGSSSSVFLG